MVGTCSERWSFPKSDLFHWTALLDRFDEILANLIDGRWNPQTRLQRDSLDDKRQLVIGILEFTRLLLENCSSRNIYCSYDRLKKLLVTDDMEILEKTLELLLIPARKLDSQSSLRNTFGREVGTDELAILAQLSLPFIPDQSELEEARFALRFCDYHAQRIPMLRVNNSERCQYIKMLSTAIFLMAQPEGSIDSVFFAMSPTIVTDTAKLITPAPKSDAKMELAALSILRSCLKSEARAEILHTLNLSASHGPIASIFRVLVDSMVAGADLPFNPMFIYAFLDFVSVLATQIDMDDSFVNSGIIAEAVRAIDSINRRYYKVLEKTLYVLDALIHHYVSAIDFFFANNGLLIIMKQSVKLVEIGHMAFGQGETIVHADSIILQCLLRFVDKLLTANGADDRLRNLLEGPFFRSITHVLEDNDKFSPEIVAHSISIVAAFIHNEPTSLSVLQEIGTPQALTLAMKRKVPAISELLAKLPHAFSAVCLNPVGAEYFSAIDPVSTLCSTFLQPEFLKILRSRGTASNLGTAMDEFIRHHPHFRPIVIKDVIETLHQVPSIIGQLRLDPSNVDLFLGCELLTADLNIPEKRTEPVISLMSEALSSFIEGLVQTPAHAKEFIEKGGIQALMEIFYSKGISFDFTVYNESLSISHMLRVLSDIDAEHVISAILISLVKHATSIDEFISQVRSSSIFASVLLTDYKEISRLNPLFQSLSSSLAVIGLLRDLYVTHSYTFARVGGALLRGFTTKEGEAALIFLSILLKVCSWEFGLLMQSLDESTAAGVLLRAASDFKAPIFASFSATLYQFSSGRKLQGKKDEILREKSANIPNSRCKNLLYISFVLQRLLTSISAVFSGLSKLLSSRNVMVDFELSEKLIGIIANSGINAVNWLNQEAQMVSLGLRSFLMTHVMQFLPVIFLDDGGSRTSLMEPIVKAFLELQGVDDLIKTIQQFMIAGVNCCRKEEKEGEEIDSMGEFSGAVKEMVHFFLKLVNPSVRMVRESTHYLTRLRAMICHFCMEFMSLPVEFRRNLGSPVLSEILLCFGNLVRIMAVNSSSKEEESDDTIGVMVDFGTQVLMMFGKIAKEFLEIAPATVPEVAFLMKSLCKEKELRLNSDEDDNNGDDDEPKTHEELEVVKTVIKNVNSIYGWVMAKDCPLSIEVRLRLLAASINSEVRKYIYPLLVQALPSFYEDIVLALERKEMNTLASGVLLAAEIVFMSTLSLTRPMDKTCVTRLHDAKISFDTLSKLTNMAVAMVCDTTQANIDVDLSVLYLLSALTRQSEVHGLINLELLIPALTHRSTECLTSKDKRYRSMSTLSTFILRHLVETPEYLAILMEIEVLVANPTSFGNKSKINSFVNTGNMEHALCRKYISFQTAVGKHFSLTWDDPYWEDPMEKCMITPKKSLNSGGNGDQIVPSTPTLKDLQDPILSPNAEKIMNLLMEELQKYTVFPPQDSPDANEKAELDESVMHNHFSRCAILINIVELLYSYPICREALIHSPLASKFLNFLLESMTPSGGLAGTLGSKMFVYESMRVSQLLNEICVGPLQVSPSERATVIPERANLVVDYTCMALRQFIIDAGSSIDTYAKMSRAWCLTMTIYVLLNIKPTASASASSSRFLSPVQSAVTARMLEKGILGVLSTILKSIDRSAPMAPVLTAKIIFSMEILARFGNKLARLTSMEGVAFDETTFGSMSEDFDDDDDEVEDMMDEDDNGDGDESMEEDVDGSRDRDIDSDGDSMDEGDMTDGEDDVGDMMDIEIDVEGTEDDEYNMMSDYTEDEADRDDTDDEDDDMMYTEDESDEQGLVRLVVHPPIGSSGPAADAVASGFQVIPFDTAGRVDTFNSAFMDDNDDDQDAEDEYVTEEESMDDGFSVEDEGDGEESEGDQATEIFDDGIVMSLQPRLGTIRGRISRGRSAFDNFSSLGISMRGGGTTTATYSSQARENDVFLHPLIGGDGPEHGERTITYGFDISRLPESNTASSGNRAIGRELLDNQDVFHSRNITTTIRRWSQENRLFIGEDAGLVATEALKEVILKVLIDEAMERKNAEIEKRKENMTENANESTAMEAAEEHSTSAPRPLSPITSVTPAPSAVVPNTPSFYEDMGPDRDFLEALPFEMRREVLEQYFEERRRNIPDGAEVRVNADFLASLPSDLRADYERLSTQEVERYRRRGNARMMGEMDFSALLQNMGPDVQRALVDAFEANIMGGGGGSAEVVIQDRRNRRTNSDQVSNLINALSESMRRLRETGDISVGQGGGGADNINRSVGDNNATTPAASSNSTTVSIPKRDYTNMIDTASLATILRVFFDRLMTEDRTHMKLFMHLCAGSSTRADLLNMLIYILEEMPEDIGQLDTVLETYTSSRNNNGKTILKSTPKKKSSPHKADPFGGSMHVIIQQRTLQVLMQLVQHNDDARKFFISAYDSPWTIKRFDKKSKATIVSTKYPIVLLLACLERSNFIQIPLLVEYLFHLLQLVSGPLKEIADMSSATLDIPHSFVSSMVKAIVNCELTPKAFQYATQVLQNLSLLELVANIIIKELSEMSIKLAIGTISETRRLTEIVTSKDKIVINDTLKTLSTLSSNHSKLLRCMKILSSTILRPLKPEDERSQAFDSLITASGINWEKAKEASSNNCWMDLFGSIDACLKAIGDEVELFHVATGLLPAIEAQFWHFRQSVVLQTTHRTSEEESLFSFAEHHRGLLNTMIRASPNLLTTGAFILLTRIPRTLDFDNKRSWFKQQLVKKGVSRPTLSIHVRRAHIFEDSFHAIMGRSGEEVKYGRLSVKFHDEEGLDAGGVTREWFAVLSRQMFDPNYALFKVSAVDKITYQPNRMSYINPDHLQYFTFIGRIIGKAIYDSRLLDCYFTRSFYKHILGIPVDFKDLEAIDPEFYNSLIWILENDITDVMELSFSVEVDEFGIHKIIDLIPDGRSITVTENNKKEYVKLVTECKLTSAIKPQIDAFLRGFHEIIPESLIIIFNEQELELLISGMPDIDVDDWRNNTEYSGYTISSSMIYWFWRIVRSFDQEYRAKLLQFVTGTSKVPLDGFASLQGTNGIQRFQIHRDYGCNTRLPSAHTCFNQLDLPEYESYEQLREMLLKAINECSTGFGLV